MKRVALSLLSLAPGVVLLLALQRPTSTAVSFAATAPAALTTSARYTAVASGTVVPTNDDRAAVRRKVRDGAPGTYISDILEGRDSSLARWADRNGVALTVWIQPQAGVPDFAPAYVAQVRAAFREWDTLNLPIRFSFVDDSAEAEIHVDWIDRFKAPISGRTRWTRDEDWVITDASITLAMHHSQGELLDHDSMRAMALHEVGHLLGLDHTKDSMSVMAPKVRVRELSAADRATIRLLYALPAGPIR